MNKFWNYFKSLNYILIEKENPLSIFFYGVANVLDLTLKEIIWVRNQFIPYYIDDQNFIKEVGNARGLQRYPLENDINFKKRVNNAFSWWREVVSQKGLENVLREYFGGIYFTIENCGLTDQSRWAEFNVSFTVLETELTDKKIDFIRHVINEVKPARSKLALLSVEPQRFIFNISRYGASRGHIEIKMRNQ